MFCEAHQDLKRQRYSVFFKVGRPAGVSGADGAPSACPFGHQPVLTLTSQDTQAKDLNLVGL